MKKRAFSMRKFCVAFVCIFTLFLSACGGGASSSVPAPASYESREMAPPQVSSAPVESEPEPEPEVDTTEETNALLQSGLWGYDDPGDIFGFLSFHGENEFTFYAAPWVPTEPYTLWGEYTVEGNIVTTISEAFDSDTDGHIPSRTFVFELSDGALVQQSGGNGVLDSQHTYTYQPYPADVDYYGFVPSDWKSGAVEMGLRIRAEPNTDAEILREVVDNVDMAGVYVLGVSQTDPAWYYVCYGGTTGFAHGDYIAVH
ncbi:SH3 domain-containing protein [Ruminococcaceae bacterium OttesenSCG-928-I18]|nr:SH3 domain-containing protein [Ruminococcaceae bacterium OttesenSCG-928-I18]